MLLFWAIPIEAQDSGYVVFVDSVQEYLPSRIINSQRKAKLKRTSPNISVVNSRQGKLLAAYDANNLYMRDGMVHCLRVAMDIWEDKLGIQVPVSFFVSFRDDLSDDIEMVTKVNYSRYNNSTSIPYSLYNQSYTENSIHDTIFVNANIDWDFTWAYDLYSGYDNLITAFLRHICHILGFGTSVVDNNGSLGFAIRRTPSVFDNLLTNGQNVKLSSLARSNSQDITSFLCQSLHLDIPGNYSIFSLSSGYVPYRSGNYFSFAEDNLMNYPYSDRSKLYNIDRKTLDVLDAIGWGDMVKPHDVSIKGSTVDAVGYGSFYLPHTFCATDVNGDTLQNLSWKYQEWQELSESYVDKNSGTGSSFILSNIAVNSYAIDGDGCTEGRVVCCYLNSGDTIKYSIPLFLEMRPFLESIEVSNLVYSSGSNYFSFDVTISHFGTETGELVVCNEYGLANSYSISGNGPTVIHVNNVFKYGTTFFELTLSNSYGDNVKLLYLNDCVVNVTNATMGNAHLSIEQAGNDSLPPTPTIKILSYEEVTERYENSDEFYTDPVVELEIEARDFVWGFIETSQATWFGAIGEAFPGNTPMPHRVTVDWGNLGCSYRCYVTNDHGTSYSEWVKPNAESSVSMPSTEEVRVLVNERTLQIVAPEAMEKVSVCDTQGRIYGIRKGVKSLEMNLHPGVYIVNIYNKGETTNKKIFIK